MLVKFTNATGNHAWVDPVSVEALDSVWSDGSKEGRRDDAKLLTRIYLKSGATIDLDSKIEDVVDQLQRAGD